MKKILAINSGSSSFKFKLFTFPDEKVISEGMADRVGLDGSTFTIKVKGENTKKKLTFLIPKLQLQSYLKI